MTVRIFATTATRVTTDLIAAPTKMVLSPIASTSTRGAPTLLTGAKTHAIFALMKMNKI